MKTTNIYVQTVLLIIFTFSFLQLWAQETPGKKQNYGGVGYFMVGYSGLQMDELNQSFKSAGIPELATGAISIGGGGHYIYKNFIIGGEGHGLAGASAENSEYKTSHSAGYGFFNLGYVVLQGKAINLYPLLGIGGGGMTVSVTDKSKLTNSFDDVLHDPARESYLNTGGFLMNFSLSSDYFFAGSKSDKYSSGFFIGLKVGYILNLTGNDWYFSGNKLDNSPKAGISGPYIRIVIGGGGIGTSN